DIVSLNAAAVLVAAGKALDLRHGIAPARAALSSGTAAQKLRNLVAHTHAGGCRPRSWNDGRASGSALRQLRNRGHAARSQRRAGNEGPGGGGAGTAGCLLPA